ncbi:hypothetical protein AB0N17_39775 [Streptomyces sp. NPDC051133]|uniref:hypothetical protein n=1 Tax=Streptomyces sp. NPDC051133 TaxID=3155521 RepID=UPI0034139DDF
MPLLKKAVLSAVLLAALGASLTACGSDNSSSKSDTDAKARASWAADQQAWADQQQASTFTVGLTGTAKWRDGTTAKLSELTRRRITDDDISMLDDGQPYLSFKITVINGTKEPLDLSGFNMVCPAGSNEVRTETIKGIPGNHLLVGDSATWAAGCTFSPSQTKLQVELTQPYNERTGDVSGTAIFTGTVETK